MERIIVRRGRFLTYELLRRTFGGDPNVEIIWASTREVFNVVEADEMGCHIITAPADILQKLPALGSKSGAELSLDAVKAFRDDALVAGLTLAVSEISYSTDQRKRSRG